MSACKLGTTPVNRLSEEQCDKLMLKAFRIASDANYVYFITDSEESLEKCDKYNAIANRIKQYKDNLKNRGL